VKFLADLLNEKKIKFSIGLNPNFSMELSSDFGILIFMYFSWQNADVKRPWTSFWLGQQRVKFFNSVFDLFVRFVFTASLTSLKIATKFGFWRTYSIYIYIRHFDHLLVGVNQNGLGIRGQFGIARCVHPHIRRVSWVAIQFTHTLARGPKFD